jgi:hypothetical protein
MLFALLALGGLCLALAVALVASYRRAVRAEDRSEQLQQQSAIEADWRDDVPPAEWWTVGE